MPEPDSTYDLGPAPPPPPPHIEAEPNTITQTDRPCPKCAYNLRGLPKKTRCPECGTHVDNKDFNDELQYGNPRWISHLAQGALITLIAWLALPPVFLAIVGAKNVRLLVLLGWAVSITEFRGLWILTTSEPAPPLPEDFYSFRRLARYTAIAVFVIDLAWRIAEMAGSGSTAILFVLLSLALIARTAMLGFHFQTLAMRLPDDALARNTQTVFWGLVLASPTLIPGSIAASFILPAAVNLRSLFCTTMPMLPFVIFYAWGLLLIGQYIKEFRASANEARKVMLELPPPPM